MESTPFVFGAPSARLERSTEFHSPALSSAATGGNGARALSAFISIANSSQEFAQAIMKCIQGDGALPELGEAGFSWDERAGTMAGHMRPMLEGEAGSRGAPNSLIRTPVF